MVLDLKYFCTIPGHDPFQVNLATYYWLKHLKESFVSFQKQGTHNLCVYICSTLVCIYKALLSNRMNYN